MLRWAAARLAPIVASAIGAEMRGHSVEPSRQSVSGCATGAQPLCPAHGQGRKDRPLALAGRDPRGRDSRFHPVVVQPEARRLQR